MQHTIASLIQHGLTDCSGYDLQVQCVYDSLAIQCQLSDVQAIVSEITLYLADNDIDTLDIVTMFRSAIVASDDRKTALLKLPTVPYLVK